MSTILASYSLTSSTLSGNYLPLSGGTVTGNTLFTQNLSANTIFSGNTELGNLLTSPIYARLNTKANLSGATFTGEVIINSDFTTNGFSNLNGTISSSNLSGSTNRLVQVNSGGTITATTEIISAYISSASTAATLLDNNSNWDINGIYTGTTITGTYQGQKHYNSNYFYEAIQDNFFIRLIRG